MTQQINSIQNKSETNSQNSELNRFLACEEIVEELVEQGLPAVYSPELFITGISRDYGISYQEARTCLKMAIKQIEAENNKISEEKSQEKLYAQSGYFYPQGYTKTNSTKPKDGMDSLSSLGSYNRLMFGIR